MLATADESAAWYTRAIARAGEKVGVEVRIERLADDASADEIAWPSASSPPIRPFTGSSCRRRCRRGWRRGVEVAADIAPEKDVDGANPLVWAD